MLNGQQIHLIQVQYILTGFYTIRFEWFKQNCDLKQGSFFSLLPCNPNLIYSITIIYYYTSIVYNGIIYITTMRQKNLKT